MSAVSGLMRLAVRINGHVQPTQAVKVDTLLTEEVFRARLIERAKEKLGIPGEVDPHAVKLYLDKGMQFDMLDLEKDDIVYIAFDGGEWREPTEAAPALLQQHAHTALSVPVPLPPTPLLPFAAAAHQPVTPTPAAVDEPADAAMQDAPNATQVKDGQLEVIEHACVMEDDDGIFTRGATAVVETAGCIVLMTEDGARIGLAPLAAPPETAPPEAALPAVPPEAPPPEAAPIDAAAGVSAAHRVGIDAAWQAPLAAMMDELQMHRLRALLEVRSVGSGEWFAEHARGQLAPGSGCSSQPLWLAWMSTAVGEVFVVLWAADERAARRGVLELGLGRAARTTHVLLPHRLRKQLHRCAYESDDLELLPRACPSEACDAASDMGEDGTEQGAKSYVKPYPASWAVLPAPLHPAPASACDGFVWVTLLMQRGEALTRLRERRAQVADEDEAAARKKQEEVMRRLRAKDPGAEVDVTHSGRGKYVLNKISFNGHLFECPVVVNPYSDVTEIVRTATYRCLCC